MLENVKTSKQDKGFTIIEVLIVLAIAGLILLIVLIAVPQLQRNQRNESRRNVLSRISTEINNYSGNNRGAIPTNGGSTDTNSFLGGFTDRYLIDTTSGDIRDTFKAPGGDDFDFNNYGGEKQIDEDRVLYSAGAQCQNGELPGDSMSGDPRDFSIAVGLEGGASFCVDNSTN